MGKFYNVRITTVDKTERVNSINEFLNNLAYVTSEISTIELNNITYTGAKFTIDNTGVSGFFGYGSSNLQSASAVYLNEDTLVAPVFKQSGWTEDLCIVAYVDEDCTEIAVYEASNNANYTGVQVMAAKSITNSILVGYRSLNAVGAFTDISTLTFIDTSDTSRIPCTFIDMFPYTAVSGTIDFLNKGFFKNNNYKMYETETLKACSTVTLLSTQSLTTGVCVALGVHCLAVLDEED